MSEDKTQAATETVSESPATETTQDSSNEQYIAESKKYRKRAQDAEARLVELEKSFAKAEEHCNWSKGLENPGQPLTWLESSKQFIFPFPEFIFCSSTPPLLLSDPHEI